ncbi:MAG: vitamin K epoxide reductase [Actinobacteria bacterium]|nr:vitamin K epoxide reductase [Actinomycetota bacterium]
MAAYQMGLIKRVPEPRLWFLDADRVDASGEAYESLRMPDAVLGLVSYSITLALVTSGSPERSSQQPWLPVAAALKVVFDAASGVVLTAEQVAKHRALCSWCVSAAAASWISLPSALPEASIGLRNLFGRRGRS